MTDVLGCEWLVGEGDGRHECGEQGEGMVPGLALVLCGPHLEAWNERAKESRRARLADDL